MSVIKGHFEVRFYKIPETFIVNNKLSLKEKGLLVTLYSLPENWKFSLKGLTKILDEGESSIRSTFKKLKEKGYIKVERLREHGQFKSTILYVYESLKFEDEPDDGNPHVEESQVKKSVEKNSNVVNGREYNSKGDNNSKKYKSNKYSGSTASKGGKFNRFPQRDYDYEDLEKKILEAQNREKKK